MSQDIRWKQRFQNFERAFLFLEKSIKLNSYDELQRAGLIQSFEFTYELGWKTLKDFLQEMGVPAQFPREIIKKAFATELIEEGHLWIEMLDKRNELTHTYNEAQANHAVDLIKNRYFPGIQQVYHELKKRM